MNNNKLIIAAAGSGKTTFLIKEALKIKKERVLITTYTQANEEEITNKFYEINNCVPENVTIQTWFSFLLQHGVKPFQGLLYEKEIRGLILVNSQSAIKYYTKQGAPISFSEENEFDQHYFTPTQKIYSDKLSKFVCRCNEKSNGALINRLSKIYANIFIDEVQDLAGYDLEFLKFLFKSSIRTLLVGDTRQVTYLTHNEKKLSKYVNGLIKDFILNECEKQSCEIDENSLNSSFRNNESICNFSSKLYPDLKPCIAGQTSKTEHDGIYLVKSSHVDEYLLKYKPMQLRYDKNTAVNETYPVRSYGDSKGLSFDRTIIYPTKPIIQYIIDGSLVKITKKKNRKTGVQEDVIKSAFDIAKFYVAITRARFSVAIVCDYGDEEYIEGILKYQ